MDQNKIEGTPETEPEVTQGVDTTVQALEEKTEVTAEEVDALLETVDEPTAEKSAEEVTEKEAVEA